MVDAIDVLLQDKQDTDARQLLEFHHQHRKFLPRVVAEFLWRKQQGRKSASAKSVFQFLRWCGQGQGIDNFKAGNDIVPLAARVCVLLWPDLNGFVRLHESHADTILGTSLVTDRKGRKILRRTKKTGSAWLSAPFPDVPAVTKPATLHEPISEEQASESCRSFQRLVASRKSPNHPVLQNWLSHIQQQPEIFAFLERTMLDRNLPAFSGASLIEYCRESIRRVAERHKRFGIPNAFGSLYCRALIMKHLEFNGRCEVINDSRGPRKPGQANRLLGT